MHTSFITMSNNNAKAPKLQQLQLQVQAINNILYPCLYADRGCGMSLKSKALDDHVKVCEYRVLDCPRCSRQVRIQDLVPYGLNSYICRLCKDNELKQPVLDLKQVMEEFKKFKDKINKEMNELKETCNNLQVKYNKPEEPEKKKRKYNRYGETRLARALNEWLQKKDLLDKVSCEQAAETFQLATKLEIPKKYMSKVFMLALDGLNSRKKSKFKIRFSPYKLQGDLIVRRPKEEMQLKALEEEGKEQETSDEEEEDDCLLIESSNNNKKQKKN